MFNTSKKAWTTRSNLKEKTFLYSADKRINDTWNYGDWEYVCGYIAVHMKVWRHSPRIITFIFINFEISTSTE